MNRGVLAFDSGGRVKVTLGSAWVSFNGGTPVALTGELAVRATAPVRFVAGLGYDVAGNLCVADGGTPASYVAGLAVTSTGQVCVSGGGAISKYVAGLPVDSLGRLCVSGMIVVSDTDVGDWVLRVFANGGSVSQATANAVVNFTVAAKANGYWSKLNRINLFCGTNLAAACVPLKVGAGTPTDTNNNFVEADYAENVGLKGNTTSKWLDTGYFANTHAGDNRHISAYEITRPTLVAKNLIGVESAGSTDVWRLNGATLTSLRYIGANNTVVCDATGLNGAGGVGGGFFLGQNVSAATMMQLWRAGVKVAEYPAATLSTVTHAHSIGVFASNRGTGRIGFTDATMGGYSIGPLLTATEVAAFSIDMQDFQQAMGRAVGPDASSADWQARVIAAGGTVSAGTLAAVETFCKAAKASGYWTKLRRINLMCGDQLAACLVPLKAAAGAALDTNLAFVAGDYTEATGLTGDGLSKCLKTGLIPSTMLTLNDTHFSAYIRSNRTGGSGIIGVIGPQRNCLTTNTGGALYSDQYDATTGRVIGSVANVPYGHVVASRVSATSHAIYRNGVQNIINATSGGALAAVECFVVGVNNNGGLNSPSGQIFAAYSIGSGLTAAEVANYYTHMQAFQTALGRNV